MTSLGLRNHTTPETACPIPDIGGAVVRAFQSSRQNRSPTWLPWHHDRKAPSGYLASGQEWQDILASAKPITFNIFSCLSRRAPNGEVLSRVFQLGQLPYLSANVN